MYASKDEREQILREQARLREKLRRVKYSYHEVEISQNEYRKEKARTERKLASLYLPQQARLGEIASLVESLAASWDHATAEERRDMIRLIFDRIYCDPADGRLVVVQPNPDFIVLFREAGIIQETEGLVWPSELEDKKVGIGAPDWTRTSTPSRAQALNLLRIPIPPQGLQFVLYACVESLSIPPRWLRRSEIAGALAGSPWVVVTEGVRTQRRRRPPGKRAGNPAREGSATPWTALARARVPARR